MSACLKLTVTSVTKAYQRVHNPEFTMVEFYQAFAGLQRFNDIDRGDDA